MMLREGPNALRLPSFAGLLLASLAVGLASPGLAASAKRHAARSPAPSSVAATPAPPPVAPAATGSIAADVVTATAARVAGDGKRTRFVADLTGVVDVAVFTLADPYRVIVDLPEIRFALSDQTGAGGRGLVSAFRYGRISEGKSRIVLDMTAPVAVDKTFVLPPVDDQPARLVVDLVPTTREAFLDTAQKYRDQQAAAEAAKAAQAPAPADDSDGRMRVVIDPGHGGIDSGARSAAGTMEKDITLAVATALADKLNASSRYQVFLTRSDDTFISLSGRVDFARRHAADLFLSIHADSLKSGGPAVRGASIYTLSDHASDAVAAQLAESENKADILAGLDIEEKADAVSDILLDLTRRETKNFAIVFARDMVEALPPDVKLFKRPQLQAGFMVLKAPDVPSALLELGYLSNPDDEKDLLSPAWRDKAAAAIGRAIDSYFAAQLAKRADR